MSDSPAAPGTQNAFCLGCGYSLRNLPSQTCPECGRPFDPADPRTMSLGHPLRPWQRWLLRPTGWPMIALAVLGTAGLAYLSRWPRLSPEPPSALLDEFHWPRPYTMPPTAMDVVFYAAVVLWAAFVGWTVLWQFARLLLVPRVGRRANVWGIDTRRRRRAILAAAILSIFFMIFGWQERVGRRWIARVMAPNPRSSPYGYDPRYDPWRRSPVKLSPAQAALALSHLIVDLPTNNERFAVLGMLTEGAGRAALPSLTHAAENERDQSLLAWEIRLIGLCRDPQTAKFLIDRLQDSRPGIRAAAADAVGILRHPSYSIYVPDGFWICDPLALDTKPLIYVGGIVSAVSSSPGFAFNGGWAEHDLLVDPAIGIEPGVRATLEKMMLGGAAPEEREAAARALVDWPPDRYRLRVAEWGVWINNDGHMALAQSLLDEIPPFVHRTGNPVSSFGSYFLYPSMVTKPIVHLTSDVPLAVDVEAQISEGRPWFGYPLPDDFAIGGENVPYRGIGGAGGFSVPGTSTSQPADDFMAPAIPSLPDCREGYPWLVPHHRVRQSEGTTFGGPALIANLGLRWQSAILCPDRLSWMVTPAVPPDPRFAWWTRLRDVPSDWVTNRGETERFLYYDGPTRAAVPLAVNLEGAGRLRFAMPKPPHFGYGASPRSEPQFQPLSVSDPAGLPTHEGLYVDVHSGHVHAQWMEIPSDGTILLTLDPALTGEAAVSARFRGMLLRYGLTGPEADGLIAAWAPQFFRAEGRRFVLRMSPAEYARQCPMQVRPTPTEVVRLGLVLTEFDPNLPATTRPTAR